MSPVDPLHLPEFKGGVLRGGFGTAFRRLTCFRDRGRVYTARRTDESCGRCLAAPECPYKAIFEPSPPEGAQRLRNLQDIPRPFVLRPRPDPRIVIMPGEHFEWDMVLVGSAIKYLPYFIVTVKMLGESGFGLWYEGKRAKVNVESVVALDPFGMYSHTVFDGRVNLVDGTSQHTVTGESIEARAACLSRDSLTVEFRSITRLKYENSFVRVPVFHVLIRNLLRRLSTLSYFYQAKDIDIPFVDLVEAAKKICDENINVRWQEWRRYSGRSKTIMDFDGFVGRMRYTGDLKPFLALLLYGSVVSVGKGATFGLGHYVVEW
jgi:hypothetical protein